MIYTHVDQKRYGCKILLHKSKTESANRELLRYWNGFKFTTYMKWRWYFRYLTAKHQVENPRYYVEWIEFSYEFIEPEQQKIKRLKDKLRSARAKITEWSAKIRMFEAEYKEKQAAVLFPVPITENKDYIAALENIEKKKKLAEELASQLSALMDKDTRRPSGVSNLI